MNSKIPIIIISYNRLLYLKELVEYFLNIGEDCIYILDNASTYQPLLDWFLTIEKNSSVKVFRSDKNYGSKIYWDISFYKNILDCKYCIITDNDILPYKKFEYGWKEEWIDVLEKYNLKKVGSAISIDDIPDTFFLKINVLYHEKNFWKNQDSINKNYFHSKIDTTLYLQKINTEHTVNNSIRMSNYLIKHRPWYINLNNLSEEDSYYFNTVLKYTYWSQRLKNSIEKANQ